LIESYLDVAKNLCGVIHVIDSRRGVQKADVDLIRYMSTSNLNITWVLSKADKLSTKEKAQVFQDTVTSLGCSPQNIIFVSVVDNTGVIELRKTIAEILSR
jgi:GTP-binding protein EngB required for normal cell division